MNKQVSSSPDVLGGTPVFRGTRVPLRTLFDYLAAGDPLARFLDDFPTVRPDDAKAVIIDAEAKLESALAS